MVAFFWTGARLLFPVRFKRIYGAVTESQIINLMNIKQAGGI